jgi:hypothetical protein
MMSVAFYLMAAQGVIGAFDTIYYHEWKARLPARGEGASAELKLHAARDFLYAVLFGSLPWFAWQGWWVIVLGVVIAAEIVITMWDFVAEIAVRKALGDVYAGERVTHGVMGILYGIMLANMFPTLASWFSLPAGLVAFTPDIPEWLRWGLTVMAAGVFGSGVRDLYAAFELPCGGWPWTGKVSS